MNNKKMSMNTIRFNNDDENEILFYWILNNWSLKNVSFIVGYLFRFIIYLYFLITLREFNKWNNHKIITIMCYSMLFAYLYQKIFL